MQISVRDGLRLRRTSSSERLGQIQLVLELVHDDENRQRLRGVLRPTFGR